VPVSSTPLVLAEIGNTLERMLKDRTAVADYLEYILRAPEFRIPEARAVLVALASYRAGKGPFSSCLLAALNQAAGCETTVTFAADIDPSAGFTRLTG
jgi:predicted nucleic-acid-binding protein